MEVWVSARRLRSYIFDVRERIGDLAAKLVEVRSGLLQLASVREFGARAASVRLIRVG